MYILFKHGLGLCTFSLSSLFCRDRLITEGEAYQRLTVALTLGLGPITYTPPSSSSPFPPSHNPSSGLAKPTISTSAICSPQAILSNWLTRILEELYSRRL
ncbi:unnamed protein product [Rhodiola kirilowii]